MGYRGSCNSISSLGDFPTGTRAKRWRRRDGCGTGEFIGFAVQHPAPTSPLIFDNPRDKVAIFRAKDLGLDIGGVKADV